MMNSRTTRTSRRLIVALVGAVVALGALVSPARAVGIKEMARLGGVGETNLWGLGLVVGLQGTGDSGDVQPLARQLAAVLEKGGSPVPELRELVKAKNVALVMVTCTIPKEGARAGDTFDVFVQAYHNAPSLKGGRLFITPLQGPKPGQGVFAFAEGPLVFEESSLTVGRVRGGARVSYDITMDVIRPDGRIELVIQPPYAGWSTSQLLASAINSDREGFDDSVVQIARAVDERTVMVEIPEPELVNPANFIAAIMEIQLDPSLLSIPARVIVNERKGTITVTGDVQISPTAVTHKDMTITTLNPPRTPTADNPSVERSRWAGVGTVGGDRSRARLQDLLSALTRLDVPVVDQIAILSQIHRMGHLHAEYIVE